MRHTRLAPLWRALPGIGIAAVAVFAAFAVATGGGAPGPVYAGSSKHTMGGMDMGAMQGASYWQDVSGGAFHSDGTTRTYYISADQVDWDYAPAGMNEITGKPFDDVADTYVKTGPGRIGSTYEKCLYRGYTDGTFAHLKAQAPDERYLGLLGPGHPRRGRRHDQGRVPQHLPVPGERSPTRRLLRQERRGRPLQRRHPRREEGRRRRADRRHAHLRLGGSYRARAPAPTTAAR